MMENTRKMPGIPGIAEGKESRLAQLKDDLRAVRVRETVAPALSPARKPNPYAGYPVIEANGLEMQAIEVMAALDAQMERSGDRLKDRLMKIPNGWRDWRLAAKTVERVIMELYATLPEKSMRRMRMIADHGEVVIRQKRAANPDYVQMIANDDLKALVNRVVANECAMCLNDVDAQKRCPLREVLERVAPTEKVRQDGMCVYLDVVAGNEYGRYLK